MARGNFKKKLDVVITGAVHSTSPLFTYSFFPHIFVVLGMDSELDKCSAPARPPHSGAEWLVFLVSVCLFVSLRPGLTAQPGNLGLTE